MCLRVGSWAIGSRVLLKEMRGSIYKGEESLPADISGRLVLTCSSQTAEEVYL